MAAYLAFTVASQAAERQPTNLKLLTALKATSVDPALANEGEHLFGFRTAGIAWQGEAPQPRVTVKAIANGAPYPTVTLADCPTAPASWLPVDTKTHKTVPITYPPGSAKPPHGLAIKVIYYKSRWLVQSTTTNVKTTCVAS